MLARLLAERHGFRCTVLFATDPESGAIDPDNQTNVTGLSVLRDADAAVVFFRFRELPDAEMRHFDEFLAAGKPILGLRTATHAFHYSRDPDSEFAHYDFRSKEWPGGFGRQVLGETWVAHHGHHGREATRGIVEEANADHPILRGVEGVFGPTDVYTARPPEDVTVLLRGEVVAGMQPDDPPVDGAKNAPMMPLAWVRDYEHADGTRNRVFCTTMGAATDFESEGLRRLLVNACYWAVGLEERIPERSDVSLGVEYAPTPFGFGKAKKGVMPADHLR